MHSQWWQCLVKAQNNNENLFEFLKWLDSRYQDDVVVPNREDIFKAFKYVSPEDVKVVILAQDPYPNKEHADGLAFSASSAKKLPKSLQNIYKELSDDLNIETPQDGNLSHWAEQGVLLLNRTLTAEVKAAGAHEGKGWEAFTNSVINEVSKKGNKVFMLWGSKAQKAEKFINNKENHLILKTTHPSPLSAKKGFFGSKHFSQANKFLEDNNIEPIQWGYNA